MSKIKDRQQKVLDFMKKEVAEKGYPPTVREICQALSIKSTSTVHKDIEALMNEGFIKKDPAKPRTLVLLDTAYENDSSVATQQESFNFKSKYEEFAGEIIEIPLVGSIAAGTPILADEMISDVFPIPARYLGYGSNFMLKVSGDSMMNVGIYDGDLILVEEAKTANNGEIVVAMINTFESEATVKTYYKEPDGRIRLQPENDYMMPMYFDKVDIIGKIKGVFRFF